MSQSVKPCVLIVEDSALIAQGLHDIIDDMGWSAAVARSADEALRWLAAPGARADLAILDFGLGASTAVGVAKELAARSIRFVVLSGFDRHFGARSLPACDWIEKPFRTNDIVAWMERNNPMVSA